MRVKRIFLGYPSDAGQQLTQHSLDPVESLMVNRCIVGFQVECLSKNIVRVKRNAAGRHKLTCVPVTAGVSWVNKSPRPVPWFAMVGPVWVLVAVRPVLLSMLGAVVAPPVNELAPPGAAWFMSVAR